jgi:hypothetical protein
MATAAARNVKFGYADLSPFGRRRIVPAKPQYITDLVARDLFARPDGAEDIRRKLQVACDPRGGEHPRRRQLADRLAFGTFETVAVLDVLGRIDLRQLVRDPHAWPAFRRPVDRARFREFRAANPEVDGRPVSATEARYAVAFAALLQEAHARIRGERPESSVWRQFGPIMRSLDQIYLDHPHFAETDGVDIARIHRAREAGDAAYDDRAIAGDFLSDLAWNSAHIRAADHVLRPVAKPPTGFPERLTRLDRKSYGGRYEPALVESVDRVCRDGRDAAIEHPYGDPKLLDWAGGHSGGCPATARLRLPRGVKRLLRAAHYSVPHLRAVTPFQLLDQCSKAADRALPADVWTPLWDLA